ncbi:MAG: hypothetical protein ACYC1M_07080 [Armatimonadota bacterium]
MANIPTTSQNLDLAKRKPRPSLKYYGFAAIDCGWHDPKDHTGKTNYIDEVAGFTNIGQMGVLTKDDLLAPRLAKFQLAKVRALLHIEPLLFDREKVTALSGTKLILRPEAEKLWSDYVKRNKSVLTKEYVAALYIVDEPAWNGLSRAEFIKALKIVKKYVPGIPTVMIEAYTALDKIMVPKELDWVGFDRYDIKDPEHDPRWQADLRRVKAARSRPDQKIVVISSTQWLPFYQTDANVKKEDMAAIAESYYRAAMAEPEVIALVGYIWPGGLDGPTHLGARNLPPNVQQTLRKIGKLIINR